jgi:hypothetical protein
LDEATIIKFLKSFNDIMFSPKQLGSFKVIAKKKKRNRRYFMRKL